MRGRGDGVLFAQLLPGCASDTAETAQILTSKSLTDSQREAIRNQLVECLDLTSNIGQYAEYPNLLLQHRGVLIITGYEFIEDSQLLKSWAADCRSLCKVQFRFLQKQNDHYQCGNPLDRHLQAENRASGRVDDHRQGSDKNHPVSDPYRRNITRATSRFGPTSALCHDAGIFPRVYQSEIPKHQ